MSGGVKAGKRFEQKFRECMEPHAYVLRIPDSVRFVGGHMIGEETDADFLVVTGEDSYLVECKAANRPRLDYGNVKPHQEAALADFDAIGERCHGFLAVEFYDKETYRRAHRMFLLPIRKWLGFKADSGRKSMPVSAFEELGKELPYVGSGYVFDGRWFREAEAVARAEDRA